VAASIGLAGSSQCAADYSTCREPTYDSTCVGTAVAAVVAMIVPVSAILSPFAMVAAVMAILDLLDILNLGS